MCSHLCVPCLVAISQTSFTDMVFSDRAALGQLNEKECNILSDFIISLSHYVHCDWSI